MIRPATICGAAIPLWSAATAALIAWSAAGLSTAAEDAGHRPAAAKPGIEYVREIRYLPQLRANPSNAERYVVKGVCERDGIREISRILEHSDFEEMWAFLPRAHGSEDCEWHEIGREERSERNRSTLRVDLGYLHQLMAENTEIHLVHFHPLVYFECAAREDCPKQAAGETGAFDGRWITDVVFSMPSPSDIHFMMNVTSRFLRRYQAGGTIRHKVVTPYGVVDYGLTEQGLARYDAERIGRTGGVYIAWVAASVLDSDRVEGIIRESPGSIGAAVARLARMLDTEYLRVVYAPF